MFSRIRSDHWRAVSVVDWIVPSGLSGEHSTIRLAASKFEVLGGQGELRTEIGVVVEALLRRAQNASAASRMRPPTQ
jgi:hypothetical protein